MFLIAGHPRSGTHFTKELLSKFGLDIRGEKYGRKQSLQEEDNVDGIVSWMHVYLFPEEFPVVLHQIRHPLQVIASSQTLYNNAFRRMFRQIDAPKRWLLFTHLRRKIPFPQETVTRWAMYTWLYWNEWIETDSRVKHQYRVENIENEWYSILDILDIPPLPMPELNTTVNTRKGRFQSLTWEQLYGIDPELTDRIREKAIDYGYTLE
ncbi:MAG: hypothetical protein U5R06_13360 [candidate division KSB1 bacterium]|nr:hypothetical protein [candidate division KSB1 bacterium]